MKIKIKIINKLVVLVIIYKGDYCSYSIIGVKFVVFVLLMVYILKLMLKLVWFMWKLSK